MDVLVRIIHYILVGFVVLTPFTGCKSLIKTNLIILGYLILKWATGYDKCGITELEYSVSGKPYGEGFLYRLLNGVIKMKEGKFNVMFIVVTIAWFIVNLAVYRNT